MWQKASTLKLHGHNFHQSYMFSKIPSVAAAPGFKSQCQSASAAPFPTPPTICYTCQHSRILPALLGCHSKSGQAWPYSVEPIISKFSRRRCNQGELTPNYILGWSHSHLPGSNPGHSYLTYLWNQLKVIDMLNDCFRGYLQNCCYSKQLSMALLHVSHPRAQTSYIYIFFFSSISWTHWVLDPIINPHLGSPPLGCTLLQCHCWNRHETRYVGNF